jgi:hypothetical protein
MCKSLINNRFITTINALLGRDNSLTKGVLSQKLGISQQKFTEILKERMNVGADLLAGIITLYPDISAEWLLTGEGSMLKSDPPSDEPNPAPLNTENAVLNTLMTPLLDRIDALTRENERLKIEVEILKNGSK